MRLKLRLKLKLQLNGKLKPKWFFIETETESEFWKSLSQFSEFFKLKMKTIKNRSTKTDNGLLAFACEQ